MFSREFCEISKNTFFTEHFWATASMKCTLGLRRFMIFTRKHVKKGWWAISAVYAEAVSLTNKLSTKEKKRSLCVEQVNRNNITSESS